MPDRLQDLVWNNTCFWRSFNTSPSAELAAVVLACASLTGKAPPGASAGFHAPEVAAAAGGVPMSPTWLWPLPISCRSRLSCPVPAPPAVGDDPPAATLSKALADVWDASSSPPSASTCSTTVGSSNSPSMNCCRSSFAKASSSSFSTVMTVPPADCSAPRIVAFVRPASEEPWADEPPPSGDAPRTLRSHPPSLGKPLGGGGDTPSGAPGAFSSGRLVSSQSTCANELPLASSLNWSETPPALRNHPPRLRPLPTRTKSSASSPVAPSDVPSTADGRRLWPPCVGRQPGRSQLRRRGSS